MKIMNKNLMETKSEKKHLCLECGSSFNRPYRLAQHLLLHQNIKRFVCGEKDCNKAYTSKSHLDRHLNSVHITKNIDIIYRCPECMKIFSYRQNLKRHMKIKHVKRIVFTCDVCKSDFKKKHLLSTHMYRHTFVKSFSCILCSKEFISLHDRRKHMKYHKTYNCAQCDMVFHQWSKYQKHRRTEHNSNEFNCDNCGRKFKQRRHMVQHVKTHMALKPKVYKCWYENCNRVYSRNSNLLQHVDIKHLQLTHTCGICDAELSTKAKLKAHLKIHCKLQDTSKPPKTLATGRRERKDKGAPRHSTALKIAGLLEPEYKGITTNSNNIKEDKKNKENSKIEIEIFCGTEKSITEKVEPYNNSKTDSECETVSISSKHIRKMDIKEMPKVEIKIDQTASSASESSQNSTEQVEIILLPYKSK